MSAQIIVARRCFIAIVLFFFSSRFVITAKIQALKKSATKGNTKKKKEVNDEITKLEAQMADKHTIELAQLQVVIGVTSFS